MKRLLALFICAVMIIPSLSFSNVSAEEIKFAEDHEMAVSVLKHIGIVSEFNTENGGNAEESVSRSKFAEMTAQLLKANGAADQIYFTDIKNDHRAFKEINALVEKNIISLADDNLFNPDDIITYEQALKILVRAMGYGAYAEAVGGYPYGYIKTASMLDLPTTSDYSHEISYAEAVELLFNAAQTKVYDVDTISADGSVAYKQSDETIFSIYWNIFKGEGRLTAYYGGSMNDRTAESGYVYIGDDKFSIADGLDAKDCFTNYIEFFSEKQSDGTYKIIYMENDTAENDGLIIDTELYCGFDSNTNTIKYYKNENSTSVISVTLPRSVRVVYNGMPYGGSIKTLFEEKIDDGSQRGTIYINSIDDGNNNLLVINAYRAFVVGHYDENSIAYNKYSTADSIDLNKCDYVNFYDEDMNSVKANLANGNVYMLAESYDKKNLKFIYFRTARVSGVVSETYSDTGELTVNDVKYKTDKSLIKYSGLPQSGAKCDMYLDSFGYVIAINEDKSADDYKFAYVIDFTNRIEAFGGNTFVFKMLVEDGSITTAETDEKIIMDGISRSAANIANASSVTVPGSTSNGTFDFSGQVIRFKTNDDGKIKEIDTTIVSDDEKANEGYNLTKYSDNVYENVLPGINKNRKQLRIVNQGGTVYRLDSNILYKPDATCVMFNVPLTDNEGYLMHESGWFYREGTYLIDQDYIYGANGEKIKADDSMYSVGHRTLSTVYSYVMDVYDTDKDSPYAECIVHHYPLAQRNRNVQLVTSFSEGVDSEGAVKKIISLRTAGADTPYYVANNSLLSGLSIGDMLIADYDSNTKTIYNITKVYDRATDTITPNPYSNMTGYESWASGGYSSNYIRFLEYSQMTRGRVLKKNGSVLYVDWNGDDVYDEIVESKGAAITVYDSAETARSNDFRSGSIADIDDYESVGENCSEIFCLQNFGQIYDVVVFK